jgi:hypothetical protein
MSYLQSTDVIVDPPSFNQVWVTADKQVRGTVDLGAKSGSYLAFTSVRYARVLAAEIIKTADQMEVLEAAVAEETEREIAR